MQNVDTKMLRDLAVLVLQLGMDEPVKDMFRRENEQKMPDDISKILKHINWPDTYTEGKQPLMLINQNKHIGSICLLNL